MPDVFPGDYFSELFDNIPNFRISDFRNGRYLAATMHGTPELLFLGPESGNAMVDLGPLTDWVRAPSPIAQYVGKWLVTEPGSYFAPCIIEITNPGVPVITGTVKVTCGHQRAPGFDLLAHWSDCC